MEVEELEDQVKFLKKEIIELASRNIGLNNKIRLLKEQLDKNEKIETELQHTCLYCNKILSLNTTIYRHTTSIACKKQKLINILNHNSIYFKPT
jgi:predicted RNase H-like nuclease (RuvC/YqgF family)